MKTGAFVLGYHGCDRKTGDKLLSGENFISSSNDYDWLGKGIYFWENNPRRAYEWAEFMASQPKFRERVSEPFVVGAVIYLGNCLDLTESSSLKTVRAAYDELNKVYHVGTTDDVNVGLPRNEPSYKADEDLTKRYLDCAVINFLHQMRAYRKRPAYDTVRGAFIEGRELYPGAMIREKTHIQIAVVNPECIHGVFRIKPELFAEG
jgi:hypothetical protein